MSKRKDKQKRGQNAGKEALPPSASIPLTPPKPEAGYAATTSLCRAPGWVLGACFAAYAAWLGVMVWLAFQAKADEPVPARVVTGAPLIVIGRAGPEGLAVTAVLKGTIPSGVKVIPLASPPAEADAADRIHFLKTATQPPDVVRYAPFDAAVPSAPAVPLLLTQVRDILRAEAARPLPAGRK